MNPKTSGINFQFIYKFIGQIFRLVYNLSFTKFLTNSFSSYQYGNFIFLSSTFEKVIQVAELNSSKAVFRENANSNFSLRQYTYYLLIIFSLIVIASIILLICLTFFGIDLVEDNKALIISIYFYVITLWLLSFQLHFSDSCGYTVESQKITLGLRIFTLTFITFIYYFKKTISFESFIILISFITFFNAIVIFFGLFKRRIFSKNNIQNTFYKFIFPLFKFSFPLFIAQLFFSISFILDRWLIHYYHGAEVQAIYGMAYRISMIILLFISSIIPILLREYTFANNKGGGLLGKLFLKSFNEIIFVMITIITFTIFNLELIISIISSPDYNVYLPIYYYITVSLLFQAIGQTVSTAFISIGDPYRVSKIETTFSIVGLVISLLLVIPNNGTLFYMKNDIALKILFIQAFSSLYRYMVLLKILKIKNKILLKLISFFFLIVVVNFGINQIFILESVYFELLLKFVFYSFIILLLSFMYKYPFDLRKSYIFKGHL